MRIVLDMQGAQTENRFRGIGRHTLALAQAIVRNRGEHDVILALSSLFPETIESIRAAFEGLLPQENIRVWYAPGPVRECEAGNIWRREVAELIREAFLASLKPDVVHISSLFEGYVDDAVTSIGRFDQITPVSISLYDLIPLLNPDHYLKPNPVYEQYYLRKIDYLRRASLLLAISESSRQEGLAHLGVPEEDVVNISSAADAHFCPLVIDTERETSIRQRYGLKNSFVMYTGGIDHRKNIEGLIRAYAKLPMQLRAEYHLAIVCSIQPNDRARLESLAKENKLAKGELILTGFVPEEDLFALYNLCKAFVFPSWHEGFGLPALEAMSCGRAVIGANTSSLPEVIGKQDALFDPKSDTSIAAKLEQVLANDDFRQALERHGLEQAKKFSWDKSAQLTIAAFENRVVKQNNLNTFTSRFPRRPLLAYVSPLPPERSGISDYSAELLPELARLYEIEVIVAQEVVSDPWIKANYPIRSVEFLRSHADRYDRVLYHFGNSTFHQHMFSLLEEVPGVVVLHDFFLSGIIAHMDFHGISPGGWTAELYSSHGYKALQYRFHTPDLADVIWQYPCNLRVLQNAQGIIVHSENSRRFAQQWYGTHTGKEWAVIPLLRVPVYELDRIKARQTLKFDENDFVVCSFGLLGPTKLNHRLLDTWLSSDLARANNCMLVFVGENHDGEYGRELFATIQQSGLKSRVKITGWADTELFRQYLAAADVGVQLRTNSRGETSAAVLDCMNYGLPTIINSNGNMADLSSDGVWKLPDKFSDVQLTEALEILWRDARRRKQLGAKAQKIIRTYHAPRACVDQYFDAIERMHWDATISIPALSRALAKVVPVPTEPEAWTVVAEAVGRSIPPRISQKQLLVDVSELVQRDAKSGIQRVVRSILGEWLTNPPEGYRVEPIYATTEHGYRYARCFTLDLLGCPDGILVDESIEYRSGDMFFGLDYQPQVIPVHQNFYQHLRNHGVGVQFMVYDLLCILTPQYFFEGAAEQHTKWLEVVTKSDGVVCISRAVADELAGWLKANGPERQRSFKINWIHLGADIVNFEISHDMPGDAEKVLKTLRDRTSFLMIGTIEPRKGHAQTIAAFEILWAQGIQVNLVIVGKQGWMVENLIEKLRYHPERGKRLFWLEGISDAYLEKIYTASTCLIAASEGEGFGLPLIEAAQHKLPILARDIPVFREVAGEHAYYFSGKEPIDLAEVVKIWLNLYTEGEYPKSANMPWLTWRESATALIKKLCNRESMISSFSYPLG